MHFWYVPVMLTIPLSAVFPALVKARTDFAHLAAKKEQEKLSVVVAYSVLMAYVTLFICLGEFM